MAEQPATGHPSPAERAAQVEQRVKELRDRRAELAAGEPPSKESVSVARHRAEESLQFATAAHHAAAQRHEELARVHERTANTYQRAAMDGRGSPTRLQQAADQHWQAAHDSHLDAVADEALAEDPEKSTSG
ncbi:hypothetical protein [Mycobacterium sp. E3198]|uniref:hypothetical protein n=1 Tax=Mycobacterium sp. E3198 TaxID=1834143 RepID=UPI0008009CB6|nr:hypothetical protein [Mycobacterium sp. E3198]OBG26579.1 hypothetical protein A5673_07535 [Mycobacterium sp. E3198]